MRIKLFVVLFFDKMRYLLLYLFLVTFSGCFVIRQIDMQTGETEFVSSPDIEVICGQKAENGVEKAECAEFDELVKELSGIADKETKVFGVISQTLFSFSSPFYQVTFQRYAAEAEFFAQFEGGLAYGMVPCPGRNEVLAGYNAAVFYQLEVGDVVNEKLDFDAGPENEKYILSGILREEEGYYSNGFYLLKGDLPGSDCGQKDYKAMIYVSGKRMYQEMISHIDQRKMKYGIETQVDNYTTKMKEKTKPVTEFVLALGVGLMVLELLFFYLTRGLEKKAGIIKALGIPDGRVMSVCGLGFASLTLAASAAVFVLGLLLFDIKRKLLIFAVPAFGMLSFIILFLQIAVLYHKITAKESMPAK